MTVARWWSLVCGCLSITGTSWSTEGNPPNAWDLLVVLVWKGAAVALISIPLILEYKERKGK